jgi:hypothetical protein
LLGGYYLHQEYSDAANRNYDDDVTTTITTSNCSPKPRSQKILIAEDETDIALYTKQP